MRLWVGTQVVHPRRVDIGTCIGTDDHQLVVEVKTHHRIDALSAGFRALGVQQKQGGILEGDAHFAAVGAELLNDLWVHGYFGAITSPCGR